MEPIQPDDTTDSWPWGKILKHVLLPKPKGSPKAGKKEKAARILVACVFGAIALSFATSGKSLPSCDGADTKGLIAKIVNDLPGVKTAGIRFVSVKGVAEQGYNKSEDIRSCQGTLVTTAGEDQIQYSVRWQDKGKGLFFVKLGAQASDQEDFTQQVAGEAVEQYQIAKRSGSAADACQQAMIVSQAFMQAKDEANFVKWRAIKRQDCARAGMPVD